MDGFHEASGGLLTRCTLERGDRTLRSFRVDRSRSSNADGAFALGPVAGRSGSRTTSSVLNVVTITVKVAPVGEHIWNVTAGRILCPYKK